MNTKRRREDDREWITLPAHADVDLDEQPVDIGLEVRGAAPAWYEAEWVGEVGMSRTARILAGPGGDPSVVEPVGNTLYTIVGRCTDTPEKVTFDAYRLYIDPVPSE